MSPKPIDLTPKTTHPQILAVDPGKRYAGVALFEEGRLVACGRPAPGEGARLPDHELAILTGWGVVDWANKHGPGWLPVVEWMAHRGYKSKTSGTLLELAGVGGLVLGAAGLRGLLVPVVDWKSTYPKAVHQPWVLQELAPDELAILEQATDRTASQLGAVSQSAASDVVDAVGIGLWAVGRDARQHKPKPERASKKRPKHEKDESGG